MTAVSWDSYPSFASQDFFKKSMESHTKVRRVEKLSPNRWDLTLTNRAVVRVFITDVYTFSASDYSRLRVEYSDVDVIVSASKWNHFSTQASQEAEADGVTTVMLGGDLMRALHEF